jgi:hypothetical protein
MQSAGGAGGGKDDGPAGPTDGSLVPTAGSVLGPVVLMSARTLTADGAPTSPPRFAPAVARLESVKNWVEASTGGAQSVVSLPASTS